RRHSGCIAQEVVLDGEECRGGARGYGELVVDVLDVAFNGLRGEDELLGHSAIREPARDQAQDLDLALAQPGRSERAARSARVAGRGEHGLDHVAVEPPGPDLLP